MIYPEGTATSWNWRAAKVKEIPEEKRKNFPKKGGGYYETFLDVEKAESFQSFEFLKACEYMGIAQHMDKGKQGK